MARYINIDILNDGINKICTNCGKMNKNNGVMCNCCDLDIAKEIIDDISTEDVVPIVRCKDCKHCGYTSNGYDRQYIMCCNKLNLDTEIYGDFYCGYAEKMEESEESERE